MKKLLSSVLAGTMLISSIGAVSVFADEPRNAATAIVEKEYVAEIAKAVGKRIIEDAPMLICFLCSTAVLVAVRVLCIESKVSRERRLELEQRRFGCPKNNLEEMIKASSEMIKKAEIDYPKCIADVKDMESTNPDLKKMGRLDNLAGILQNNCINIHQESYNRFVDAMLKIKPGVETLKRVEAFANDCTKRDLCTVFGDIIDECKSWSDYVIYRDKRASCGYTPKRLKSKLRHFCSGCLVEPTQNAEISKICADVTVQK